MTDAVKPVRRIVCIDNDAGKSEAIADGPSPDVRTDPARPGFTSTRIWVTDRTPARIKNIRETLQMPHSLEPPPGGSLCRIVTFPPDAVFGGRTTSSTFQQLAERIQDYIREQMPMWKTTYDGVETMTLAVMGCVVNGPGESKAANIGISLPGTGESPNCPIFIDGRHATTLRGTYEELADAFQGLVDEYVATRYPRKS